MELRQVLLNLRVLKRSVVVSGRRTSVSLEEPFWLAVKDIAAEQNITLSTLVERVSKSQKDVSLSSRIRLFVLGHYTTLYREAEKAKGK